MKYNQSLGILMILFSVLSCSKGKFEEGTTETSTVSVTDNSDVQVEEAEVPNVPSDLAVPIVVDADTQTVETSTTQVVKNPLFADCALEPDRPIVADLYQLPINTQLLPDYTLIKAIKKICLSQLDIKLRAFSEGFPGVANLFEWFSLDTRFIVKVPQDGIWTFKLIADDGAILYIGSDKIIDNDGVHAVAEKIGTADLKTGELNFRVSYFQGPRFNIALELMWKGPNDTEFTYIPKANLKRPPN